MIYPFFLAFLGQNRGILALFKRFSVFRPGAAFSKLTSISLVGFEHRIVNPENEKLTDAPILRFEPFMREMHETQIDDFQIVNYPLFFVEKHLTLEYKTAIIIK